MDAADQTKAGESIGAVSVENPRSMKRWLKEPLLHFALLGALIFAVNAWREPRRAAEDAAASSKFPRHAEPPTTRNASA